MWTLRSWRVGSVHEQVFATLHERLHHELQHRTLWGLITRFADDYTQHERYRNSARLLFWIGVMRARLVHETFATTLAAGVDPDYVALLDANPEYRARYDAGMALLGSTAATWPRDRFVIDTTLRACMLSPGLALLAESMPLIRAADLDRVEHRPDERLAQLQKIDLTPLREAVIEAPSSIAQLNELHDLCAEHLTRHGLATADSVTVRAAVHALVARARDLLGLEITIDEVRDDPVTGDVAELQRERIELHDRALPAVLTTLRAAAEQPRLFVRDHPTIGNHVLIVWVRPDVLARQLTGFAHSGSGHVLALQAADSDDSGREVVRLAIVVETNDPSELASAFTNVETLILTTLSSLVDAPPDARFSGEQDLYVLVDQPVVEALEHAFARGAPVRWARLQVGGDRHMKGITWEATALPGVVHLHLASEAVHLALVRWLAAQPTQLAVHDQTLLRTRQAKIDAIVQHLIAAWHVLERQDRPIDRRAPLTAD